MWVCFISQCLNCRWLVFRANYGTSGDPTRVQQLRGQVDEVKGVMLDNIDKVAQRGEKLDDLGERAGKKIQMRQHVAMRIEFKFIPTRILESKCGDVQTQCGCIKEKTMVAEH